MSAATFATASDRLRQVTPVSVALRLTLLASAALSLILF